MTEMNKDIDAMSRDELIVLAKEQAGQLSWSANALFESTEREAEQSKRIVDLGKIIGDMRRAQNAAN